MIVSQTLSDAERNDGHRVADTQVGDTVEDALSLLKKAKVVFVTVPHGFGRISSHCRVTKAAARRWLNRYTSKPSDRLHCRLVHFRDGKYLFFGSIFECGETTQ
jgi:hypothetical protein